MLLRGQVDPVRDPDDAPRRRLADLAVGAHPSGARYSRRPLRLADLRRRAHLGGPVELGLAAKELQVEEHPGRIVDRLDASGEIESAAG